MTWQIQGFAKSFDYLRQLGSEMDTSVIIGIEGAPLFDEWRLVFVSLHYDLLRITFGVFFGIT